MSEDKPRRFPIPRPGVLLAIALVLVVIAVGLNVWMPYHREQVAIREIKRLGGFVTTEHGGPDWLRDLLGDEWMKCFDYVAEVNLTVGNILHGVFFKNTMPICDNDLRYLSVLTKLERLTLNGKQVSDAGLKHLSGLTNLEELWLDGTQVSDDGLKYLSGLAKLRFLYLERTQVTDEGVESLKQKLPLRRIDR